MTAACRAARSKAARRNEERRIRPRIRKLFGAVALMMLVIAWSLGAMAIAQNPRLQASAVLQFAYYVIAGLGWVPLAMVLIAWMSRVRPR